MTNFQSSEVAAVFDAYPSPLRQRLLELRALILKTAGEIDGVGEIEETLKWGQPSYLTPKSKSGTTIRIDKDKSAEGGYALYVNCQSDLVEAWRERYPEMKFLGSRSLHFSSDDELPLGAVKHCIGMALTYHARKKAKAS